MSAGIHVERPGYTENVRRHEDAKCADVEEKRAARGPSVWTPVRVDVPAADLPGLARQLLSLAIRCISADCVSPATREVRGTSKTPSGPCSAHVYLCDACDPPHGGAFQRYEWGKPFDLSYAAIVRALLASLGDA